MSSKKIDELFSQELKLYSDLDKLIAQYILPLQSDSLTLGSDVPILQSDLLNKLQRKQQEIGNLYQEQIQAMRILCKDADFKTNYPLFIQFISQCIDFSKLSHDSDIEYLCYLSIYKLLSTSTGSALISSLSYRLSPVPQKIRIHSVEEDNMSIKELEFYHPGIDRCNRLYVSAGNHSNLVPLPIFISFGHELIHLLHHLLDFTFHAKKEDDHKEKERKEKESKRYFKFFLTHPKRWLYTTYFEMPEKSKLPHEYITIEGKDNLLNGLCENRLRTAYALPEREGWRAVEIKGGNAKLKQYFFLTEKLASNKLLSHTETEELRFSNADGTLPAFFQRHRNKVKATEPTKEVLENSSAYSFCSIL